MKLLKPLLISVLTLGLSPIVLADQLAYIPLDQAEAAKSVLLLGPTTILAHCEPCEERDQPEEMFVNDVAIRDVNYQQDGTHFYQVEVNNKPLDLAYTFIKNENFYVNLGQLIGQESFGTSIILTHEYVNSILNHF